MTVDEMELICKKFYEQYTDQYDMVAGDGNYVYFYHAIMGNNVRVSLDEAGELVVEDI